jgi:type IV pilus assembly protein PilA
MTCPSCGTVNQPVAVVCVKCGQSLSSGQGSRRGLALTAMVLGIVSYPLMCAFGLGFVTALVAIVCGIIALVKLKRAPGEFGGKGSAIAGLALGGAIFALIPVWLIVAAIAIPSLLRARMAANESAALGDVRTLISAEAVYAGANGGYYDKLECLAQPALCIPGPSAPSQAMIDTMVANTTPRHGYEFALHLGPQAPPESGRPASPSSVTSYAYVAVPVKAGNTGLRAFCGDETGVVRFSADGSAPTIFSGRCPESWPVLR